MAYNYNCLSSRVVYPHQAEKSFSYNKYVNSEFNDEFWCETCDRGFKSKKMLEDHKSQHQKCNIDGCQFIAHPNVITKHIQMQHSTGLYSKIANLNNPDEIKKWREERKKKYPTLKNVEKKKAEVKEKIERGEKMGLSVNRTGPGNYLTKKRPFEKCNPRKDNKKIKKYSDSNINGSFQVKKIAHQKVYKITPILERTLLKPFTGVLQILPLRNDEDKQELSNDLIEDDEYMNIGVQKNVQMELVEPTVCGALASLINNYDSSDDEETEKHETEVKSKTTNHDVKSENDKNNIIEDEGSGPEEISICKETITEVEKESVVPIIKKSTRQQNSNKVVKTNYKHVYKHKIPSTLLEKLLRNEIRHERNIILQCVRFVVKNNFFIKTHNKTDNKEN